MTDVTAESLNDYLQMTETRGQAKELLEGHPVSLLRAVADLNHLDTTGSKVVLMRRLVDEVHGARQVVVSVTDEEGVLLDRYRVAVTVIGDVPPANIARTALRNLASEIRDGTAQTF